MGKAGDMRHSGRLVAAGAIQRVIPGIGVGVQEPAEPGEMLGYWTSYGDLWWMNDEASSLEWS